MQDLRRQSLIYYGNHKQLMMPRTLVLEGKEMKMKNDDDDYGEDNDYVL